MVALLSAPAFAVDKRCETTSGYVAKLAKIVKKVCELNNDMKDACSGLISKSIKEQEKYANYFIKTWNDVVGKSWAKVGPRHYTLGSGSKGTIVSPGQRAWIARNVSNNSVSITVKELDGKLEANFNVCVIDKKGKVSYKASKTFKSKKKKEKHTITVNDVKGKFVIFKLATAKVSVGKKLKYSFSSSTK